MDFLGGGAGGGEGVDTIWRRLRWRTVTALSPSVVSSAPALGPSLHISADQFVLLLSVMTRTADWLQIAPVSCRIDVATQRSSTWPTESEFARLRPC